MISTLPPELMEHIYSYCLQPDLMNLAFCSKEVYASVKRCLWRQVKVPWQVLTKRRLPDMVRNLRNTLSLCLCDRNTEKYEDEANNNSSHHNNNNNYCNRQLDTTLYTLQNIDKQKCSSNAFLSVVSTNYTKILSHCNSYKLRRLHITGLPINLDIKQTADVLKNLCELSLTGIGSHFDWNHLTALRHLQRLSFERCDGLNDESVSKIVQCQKLEELTFKVCISMRDGSLKSISTLKNLQKLSIFNNTFITGASFKHLHHLNNLEHLHIESALINDESLLHLSQTLTQLRTLKLIGCCKISDVGFSKVDRLVFLRELDIKMCWRITGNCFQYIRSLLLLRTLSFTSVNLTASVFGNLQQMKELMEVNITNVDCQLTVNDGAVERFCSQTGMKKQCLPTKVSFSNVSTRKFQTVFLRRV